MTTRTASCRPRSAIAIGRLVTGGSALCAVGWFCVGAAGQPFQSDIDRWVAQDQLDPLPTGGVLFIGSSSIRRWEQLTRDFADYNVIQRGFGGAQFEDVNFFVNDIVLPYAPSAIVVWAGTNDLSQGEPGAEVFTDYQTFVALVHAQQPDVEILYLGVTPTPANGGTTAARDLANALIEAEASTDPRLFYIDLPSAFYALNPPNDPAFTSLYVDPVHINRSGYDLWSSLVRPVVLAEVVSNKVFVPNPDTPQPGDALLFDFGPSNPQDGAPTVGPDANGNIWNNWVPADGNAPINAGEHIGGLVDTAGGATGIGLTIAGGFSANGIVNGGLLSPDPALLGDLAVGTATQDYFFSGADDLVGGGNDDIPGGLMLDGLDPAFVYELSFFGSRSTPEQVRETRFDVFGANTGSAVLRTTGADIGADGTYDGNDSDVAVVSGIRPDAFGQVFVDLTVARGTFAYLNAMKLRVVPLAVAAQPADAVVDAGGDLVFSATVEGSLTSIQYRWERDGVPLADDGRITGSATPTLTVASAGRADAGRYRLVITAGGEQLVTDGALGGVRVLPSDEVDFNNDGSVDVDDVLDFVGSQG